MEKIFSSAGTYQSGKDLHTADENKPSVTRNTLRRSKQEIKWIKKGLRSPELRLLFSGILGCSRCRAFHKSLISPHWRKKAQLCPAAAWLPWEAKSLEILKLQKVVDDNFNPQPGGIAALILMEAELDQLELLRKASPIIITVLQISVAPTTSILLTIAITEFIKTEKILQGMNNPFPQYRTINKERVERTHPWSLWAPLQTSTFSGPSPASERSQPLSLGPG